MRSQDIGRSDTSWRNARLRAREFDPLSRRGFRSLGLLYAFAAALGTVAFFATFIFFLGNLPKLSQSWIWPSADTGPAAVTPALALLLNGFLLTLFSLQHSVMARPFFKRFVSRLIPPPLERATYVHAANLAGLLFIALWQPVPLVLWDVKGEFLETLIWIGFAVGWLLLFAAAFSINVFELLGLRQAWRWFIGKKPSPLELKTNWLYRYFEHPMYVGVILGFWMTPYMTLGHAALAAQLTLYIAVAVSYERRDLRARFGRDYDSWRSGQGHHEIAPPLPTWARVIAGELSHRYRPITVQPLPPEIRALLARL